MKKYTLEIITPPELQDTIAVMAGIDPAKLQGGQRLEDGRTRTVIALDQEAGAAIKAGLKATVLAGMNRNGN